MQPNQANSNTKHNHLHHYQQQMADESKYTITYVLTKISKNRNLIHNSEFVSNLFSKHPQIIIQMIQWVTMPNAMATRKKINSKFQPLIYLSKDFMKENWCFYQQLYLHVRQGKFAFNVFFSFLKPQNYDEKTIYTALSYFEQILIPFTKYQFTSSQILSYSNLNKEEDEPQGIMQVINEELILQIIEYCHFKPIYDFLVTAFLVSVDDIRCFQISNILIDTIFRYPQVPNLLQSFSKNNKNTYEDYDTILKHYQFLINIAKTMKQLIENTQPNFVVSLRLLTMLKVLLRSKIIYYVVQQLLKCSYITKGYFSQNKEMLVESMQYRPLSQKVEKKLKINKHIRSVGIQKKLSRQQQPSSALFMSTPMYVERNTMKKRGFSIDKDFEVPQIDEDQFMEILLRILTKSMIIYEKLPIQYVPPLQSPEMNPANREQYYDILEQYQAQIQFIFYNMEELNKIVYKGEEKFHTLQFSSGQSLKKITLMKHQYLNLLYHSLIVSTNKDAAIIQLKQQQAQQSLAQRRKQSTKQQNPDCQSTKIFIRRKASGINFELNVQKLFVIEVIQKYLSENRWNNIAHHLLEKISHVLIVTRPEYLISNIEKDRNQKISQSFLAYLFENFMRKDFIYLDTFRFTSQGNLHSLYNISKFLAYSLNSTNKLVLLLNQFDVWQKFIISDLKKYEDKTYPKITLPDPELRESMSGKYEQIRIDQVDTITKLIEDISVSPKWPDRASKRTQKFRKSLGNQHQKKLGK